MSPNRLNYDYAAIADDADTASGSHDERRTQRGTIREICEIRVIGVPPC
jgi:hypothetical protein